MALPIKDTPILKGREAGKFIKKMMSASKNKVPKVDYDRAQRIYRKMVKSSPALA